MTSVDSTTKTCSKCKQTYPATLEFFYVSKTAKSGLMSWCRQCHSEAAKIWHLKNREKSNENSLRWAEENREKKKAYDQTYRTEHQKERYQYNQAWFAANPIKHREYLRKYKTNHPEVGKAATHRRRALKVGAEGNHVPFDEKAQLKRQKSRCYYCQCKLTEYHVEHIVPLSRGGSDHPDNKVLACPSCNLSKQDKLPSEWLKGGRLL